MLARVVLRVRGGEGVSEGLGGGEFICGIGQKRRRVHKLSAGGNDRLFRHGQPFCEESRRGVARGGGSGWAAGKLPSAPREPWNRGGVVVVLAPL